MKVQNEVEYSEQTKALSKAIDIDLVEAKELIDSSGYLVLTDEEASEIATDYIKDSLWAFNASFIIDECGLDYSLEDMLTSWQREKCEDANDGILSLIENSCGIDDFVKSAISADGRGHFTASYDGCEIEQDGFFIYRIN